VYASFLLKYSKSYLHTCIIFYMFILFFPSMLRTRTCHVPLAFWPPSVYTPPPSHLPPRFFETLRHLYPFLSLLLSINQRFLPFARFVRHRSSTMNTVRYASVIRERKEKKEKKRRKRVPYKPQELTRPASSVYVCTYVLCVCVCFHMCIRVCINLILSSYR